MAEAIWQGIILGFGLAFLIGPVFFLILFTSINKGFKPAVSIATGVMLSDAFCIFLAHISNGFISQYPIVQKGAAIFGGGLLLVWGLQSILKKAELKTQADLKNVVPTRNILRNLFSGFITNTLNPFALIFWIGVTGAIASKNFDESQNIAFYVSALAMVLTTDIAKSYLASSIQHILNVKVIRWMNLISGAALIIFGIKVLMSIFMK